MDVRSVCVTSDCGIAARLPQRAAADPSASREQDPHAGPVTSAAQQAESVGSTIDSLLASVVEASRAQGRPSAASSDAEADSAADVRRSADELSRLITALAERYEQAKQEGIGLDWVA